MNDYYCRSVGRWLVRSLLRTVGQCWGGGVGGRYRDVGHTISITPQHYADEGFKGLLQMVTTVLTCRSMACQTLVTHCRTILGEWGDGGGVDIVAWVAISAGNVVLRVGDVWCIALCDSLSNNPTVILCFGYVRSYD